MEVGGVYRSGSVTRVVGSRRVLFPLPKDDQQIVRFLRDRIEAREFHPVIDRTYALDDILKPYRYVDTEQKVGTSWSPPRDGDPRGSAKATTVRCMSVSERPYNADAGSTLASSQGLTSHREPEDGRP